MARPEQKRSKNEVKDRNVILSFPSKPLAHSVLLIFKDYSYSNIEGYNNLTSTSFTRTANDRAAVIARQLQNSSGIELPFPKNLSDENSLRINGFERDAIMEYVTAGLAGAVGDKNVTIGDLPGMAKKELGALAEKIQSAGKSFAQDSAGTLKGIVDEISKTSVSDGARAAAYLLRSYVPGIERTAALVTGQTINPRETLAFEGVNLKSFSFSWQLFPNSEKDSDIIKAIVQMIKKNALPLTEDLLGFNRVFLRYPSIVEIRLLGIDPSHFIQFKPAMITGFTVDYGSGGNVPIAQKGRPATVNLTMNFTELQIRTADDEYGQNKTGTVSIEDFNYERD